MSKIIVGLIGTAQWCLENEGPEKKGKFGAKLKQMSFLLLNAQFYSDLQILKTGVCRIILVYIFHR